MRFIDRSDAGRRLAVALARFKDKHPVVLALPRGGVPVASEIAAALEAPLYLVMVRKLGAPGQPELAIGAITDGVPSNTLLDERAIAAFGIPQTYIEETIAREAREIERRRALYLQGRESVALPGRTVIVVDDGLATGATMRVALRSIRRQRPASVVLAVPVAAPDSLASVAREADDVVCLYTPHQLGAISPFYTEFEQVEDREVIDLLDRAARRIAASGTGRDLAGP